jgi:PAS domain S-box-containing protein
MSEWREINMASDLVPTETSLLHSRIRELEESLEEVRSELDAIRRGDIDAVMVTSRSDNYDLHTLQSVDHPYQTLIEHIQEGAITLTDDGTILYGNERLAGMIGVSKKVLLGQKLQKFLSRSDSVAFMQMLSGAKWTSIRGEITLRPVAGGVVPVYISLNFLRKKDDETLVCGVLTDITEHKEHLRKITEANTALVRATGDLARARDLAEQANGAKTRFLASMTHELRTPLNGVLGYAQLLRLGGDLNAKQLAQVNAMMAAGAHLLNMINNVLTLSEIEAEHVELRPAEVDLKSIASECLGLVRPAAVARSLALDLAISAEVPLHVVVDATRLRQILSNLLSNAVKYTARGSVEVRIGLASGGEMLRVEVADTGPGIPVEDRPRLFHDFERMGGADTSRVEGAGLGLALSGRLAAIMGGELGYADNPGGGSVFCLKLPLVTDGRAARSPILALAASDVARETASTRAQRVLIVDDTEMNREIAGAFLQAVGREITYAGGGVEAVDLVTNFDFDVVLMDVRMPVVDGLEATSRIRALGGVRGCVPIIALTAQTFAEQIEACRQAGMNDYVAKPFTLPSLLDAMERGIASVRAQATVRRGDLIANTDG